MICLPRIECCVDGDHKKPNDTRTGPAGGALGGLALAALLGTSAPARSRRSCSLAVGGATRCDHHLARARLSGEAGANSQRLGESRLELLHVSLEALEDLQDLARFALALVAHEL